MSRCEGHRYRNCRTIFATKLMVKPVHPDHLDAVSASQDSSVRGQAVDVSPASVDEARTCLELFARQRSSNLPRKLRTRSVLLASISLLMDRYRAYSESELNDLLRSWLSESGLAIDHVACRRHLVEHGFVRRDRAGQRYIADYSRIEVLLSGEVLEFARELILEI